MGGGEERWTEEETKGGKRKRKKTGENGRNKRGRGDGGKVRNGNEMEERGTRRGGGRGIWVVRSFHGPICTEGAIIQKGGASRKGRHCKPEIVVKKGNRRERWLFFPLDKKCGPSFFLPPRFVSWSCSRES
jgi:hypothetical protein